MSTVIWELNLSPVATTLLGTGTDGERFGLYSLWSSCSGLGPGPRVLFPDGRLCAPFARSGRQRVVPGLGSSPSLIVRIGFRPVVTPSAQEQINS